MRILPSKLISEVQREFNTAFPYLKLEFFQDKAGDGQNGIKFSGRRIGDFQNTIADGSLDVWPEMKVNELEKTLKEKFRLNAQVFRRSGKLWLQTTMTDNWTLKKQNEHGMELSRITEIPIIDKDVNNPDDYR